MASPATSAGYLTVSEVFPTDVRALAIAVFYGYLVGAGFVPVAAAVELRIGVAAARHSLEEVAKPLTAISRTGPA